MALFGSDPTDRRCPFTGQPEAALTDADDAIRNAREMGQAATLMYALDHAAVPYTLCGNHAAVAAQAQEVVALAEEKSSPFWKAFGLMNQGSALALAGRASDAIEMLISGILPIGQREEPTLCYSFAALGARPCGAWAIRGGLALHW